MAELVARLQHAVGETYRLEKELGGGGMSRVFLAEEVRLGRNVVIKVLPPEMAAGVNVERFEREIRLAARLQHPHVVPLLTAGASGDLLFYVMPFIKGESLRAKLAREGELPIAEAARILRDVADALAYAHREGVIHRDIKPDNVLPSDNHAVVTDFGVAKAVSAATGESSLTSLGVALGTPAYMAPEQAVADPHVDHRADIYALGALGYEMLSGRPPFTGPNPQAVLSAHVTEAADPVTKHRETVPPALNDVVMRCLAKKAADRWQKAEDVRAQFEAMVTPSGGMTPTGTQPVQALAAAEAARKANPVRVAALFGLAAVGVLAIVYGAVQVIGLPDWVFYGAIGLLAIGLPIMLVTGRRERQRAMASATGVQYATPAGLQRHFTWRKAVLGGVLAFVGLAVMAGGYMAMRLLGIGPLGTLVAAGVLNADDRVIVADFVNNTPDSTLGLSLTEALRVGLAESRVIRVADASTIRAALRRMARDPRTVVSPALAQEIAQRQGIKAVIAPEIGPIGEGFVLTARLLSPDGTEHLAVAETAENGGELIAAIGRLSAKLRERIGESLKTMRRSRPLNQVTTPSLEALKKFSQGNAAFEAGDYEGAIPLLQEAVALDTGFAMAYRKMGQAFGNAGLGRQRAFDAVRQAYVHRDRLTERERYITEGTYYQYLWDNDRAIATYGALLDAYPMDEIGLVNTAVSYMYQREWDPAEEFYRRAIEQYPAQLIAYRDLTEGLTSQARFDAAEAVVDSMAQRFPGNPLVALYRGGLAYAQGHYPEAEQAWEGLLQVHGRSTGVRAAASEWLANANAVRGRLRRASAQEEARMQAQEERGLGAEYLRAAADLAWLDVRARGAPREGWRRMERALRQYPPASLPRWDRFFLLSNIAYLAVSANQVDSARAWLAEVQAILDSAAAEFEGMQWQTYPVRFPAEGALALAQGRAEDAIGFFRRYDQGVRCRNCPLPLVDLAAAYDRLGQPDSAIAVLERYVAVPDRGRLGEYATALPGVYRHLGELYETRGDRAKAAEYYGKFVEMLKDADPELQPQVSEVKARLARLVGEGGPR